MSPFDMFEVMNVVSLPEPSFIYRRLGAKGSYLTLVRVADRILQLRCGDMFFIGTI